MLKNYFFVLTLIASSLVFSQDFVTVTNIVRTGNFAACPGSGDPIITAEMITSDGSQVVNGNLQITDPCGYTTLRITMSNLTYDHPGANWPHGFFFPEGETLTVDNVNLPAGWIAQDSCTGASCSNQITGGVGFYYDGSMGSSCNECNPTENDGIPSNNYGQSSMDCYTPFGISYDLTFCNSKVETALTTFKLTGSSDGDTGCWIEQAPEDNSISFSINTIASEIPLFESGPDSPEVITECLDGGAEFNYIAVLEAECGTGDDVTWWTSAEGGVLLGTGSPFYWDPPGQACPQGAIVYASCCPDGGGCERKPVIIGPCPPPSDVPTFEPIPPQCPGMDSPLPEQSLEGVTGTWTPEFDPFNTATYTFTPDPGQCATIPVEVEVVILPMIDLTFEPVGPLCQGSEPPPLPDPDPNVGGTWSPAVIDTGTPGVFEYVFTPDNTCSLPYTLEITILESVMPEFEITDHYCQYDTPDPLPTSSVNGITGVWSPAVIDTNTPGVSVYTFTPDAGLCAFPLEFTVEIYEQPVLNTIPEQQLCDENFDGIYHVNLTGLNPILGGGEGIGYSFYASLTDYNNNNPIPNGQLNDYQLNQLPATVYVTGTSEQGCISEAVQVTYTEGAAVEHNSGPFGPIEFCKGDAVDLTQFQTQISSAAGVQFGYFENLNNAQIESGLIANPTDYSPASDQTSIFVRLEAPDFCPAIVEITLLEHPLPDIIIPDSAILCPGDTFEVTATSSDPDAVFQWTLNDGTTADGATITITEIGTYTVTAYSLFGCASETRTLTVSLPSTPVISQIEINGNQIVVHADNGGSGTLEYSLDGVFWQTGNQFGGLVPGEIYTVWVRSDGCMISKQEVAILSVPNFISPNGDGINDTWSIRGIQSYKGATIRIFDRYGKIFVDRKLEGTYEWDGKYMGRTVASDDYWYIIHIPATEMTPEQKFVGHISVRNQ